MHFFSREMIADMYPILEKFIKNNFLRLAVLRSLQNKDTRSGIYILDKVCKISLGWLMVRGRSRSLDGGGAEGILLFESISGRYFDDGFNPCSPQPLE